MIVGIFYSLEALYGERRDRSILFWKSLPVSDLTAVLSKLSIPLVIIPLLSFAITLVTQFIMLLLSSVVLLGSGMNIGDAMVPGAALSRIAGTFLSHHYGSRPVVRAHLRLAAAGFRRGAARTISLGGLAAIRDLRSREDCF